MFWQLVVTVVGLACVAWCWSRRRLYRLAAEVPSPFKSYPIIGHAYMFSGSSEDRMTALQKTFGASNQQGGFSSIWLAHKLFICMTDPAAIEVVSKTCLDKDEFTTKFTRTALGYGSIFAPVHIWHPRRKIMAPFFSLKNLNHIVAVFDKKSATMVELMRHEAGGGDFSVWNYINTYTFDSVCETAMGININSQENPDHHYILCAMNEITEKIASRALQPWLHPHVVYERTPSFKQFRHHRQCFHTFIDEIIQMKRKEMAAGGSSDNNNNKSNKTFMETAVPSSGGIVNGYTDIELREELMVLATAGTDTSAVGVSFTAVLLSRYPAVQDRVYQELKEVFGDSDRAVTPEDLLRLPYLEAVIKESLRLYPPVPLVVREVHKDMVLPSGTNLVNGTSIGISIWGTHRNPAYWGADAELFRPERFLQGALPHPAMFIPFSYSVRGCIGSTYAMRSAMTVLANLVRRYRLLPPAGERAADMHRPLRVYFCIMMKAVDNFMLRVEMRK